MLNKYRNLWRDKLLRHAPEFYENDARQVACHRSVRVFRVGPQSFDFVQGDACIMQRCGVDTRAIDAVLDGKDPVAAPIAEHLRRAGFSAISYAECEQAAEPGDVADDGIGPDPNTTGGMAR
jgi:hypothetical protein